MFTRTFDARHFLRRVYGTWPFMDYCKERGIDFAQRPGVIMQEADFSRWLTAVRAMPSSSQETIDLELSKVDALANPTAIARLVDAAMGLRLVSDLVPGETAQALWFFLQHPRLFQEVFVRHEIEEIDAWRTAHTKPGITLADPAAMHGALAASLKEFFRIREGTGRFCAVDTFAVDATQCIVARLSDRLQLLDVFSDAGEHTMQTARPVIPLIFTYEPVSGRVSLKTRQRSREKVLGLLQCFGSTVLGVNFDERSLRPVFRLDVLKRRFDPLLNGEDMEMVRVKALHLVYPGRTGRRRVKLETLGSDNQFAILDLLQEHGGSDGTLEQLEVVYAELQVKLRTVGGSKSVPIRLWRDRCGLDQTALGRRLHACLQRWGLTYDG